MATLTFHVPVLADTVVRLATGRRRAVDATVGGGGHARRLHQAGLELLCCDRDPEALTAARAHLGNAGGISYLHAAFGDAAMHQAAAAFSPDLVLLDLGVSSRQLDADQRGFSFRPGTPLDMRMDPGERETAADLLNRLDARDLEHVFRTFGDERRARRLALTIVERRGRSPMATSDDLVGAIRRALGPRTGPPDFARLFQAVRIAVNQELDRLEAALPALRDALVPGGLLLVITYHSGEDRVVKHMFRAWSRDCVCPEGQPVCTCRGQALGTLPHRRPLLPSDQELEANPRARSARLRTFARNADGG